ncbi:sensor histidine kinase [Ornithinimicrobium cryptoxanthini]|uniref:histidine kinase n=1 Tax=Ornithinimicrobium cryptoxanthini TaxID=2934161 RepID=A0ABY4YJ25_9MICO|nr:sensor histidine kinase [Ornithinimicrobium cryptoxanthini]USQ76609.1 sensor histidine kinase [Ornithinimicrobium cryptoxanthini]
MERQRRRQWVVDICVAVLLAGVGLLEIWAPFESVMGEGSRTVSSVGVVLFAAFLSQRRARPWVALTGVLVWPALGAAVGAEHMHLLFFGQLVPLLVLTFTIARHGQGSYRWVGTAAVAGFITFADLFVPLLAEPSELIFHWSALTLVWLTGHGLRVSADRAAAEAVRAHLAETTSREAALRAISDERARIARELHDIVAHSVGVIVVQAGAAEQVVEEDPEFARRALATIRSTGSGALVEMRRVVTMLRDPDLGHDLAPQPGIAALPDLVTSARDAGLHVDLEVTGERPPLPAGLDLTAYRVVQEALTNVRRHSEATRAQVAMAFLPGALEIEVSDAGPSRGSDDTPGHGLLGMRERVALFGGQVETDTTGGVFTVRAVLPLERA